MHLRGSSRERRAASGLTVTPARTHFALTVRDIIDLEDYLVLRSSPPFATSVRRRHEH
jgi:hypothetical protein